MYNEVKEFESNYKKERENKEISTSTESTDRTEETDITEETKEEGTETVNLETEEKKIESEEN